MVGEIVTKSAVSVSEMARMVGLSRARFYQLVKKGTFPPADEDPTSKRPCYFEEKQRQILEARRRNCGVDGKPILFYSRRSDAGQKRTPARPPIRKAKDVIGLHTDLIDGLAALNLTATAGQIEPLLKELFPSGIDGVDLGEVIRAVFLRIQRQNPGDKQGR
jgi:hypothetical protein